MNSFGNKRIAIHHACLRIKTSRQAEVLADLAGGTFQWPDIDRSWLEWPDIDLSSIFDWFDWSPLEPMN